MGAHFVAYPGFREPLHGHNYTVTVSAGGPRVGTDGYLVDFSDLKKAMREACKQLDQRTLLPSASDVLHVKRSEGPPPEVEVICEDGCRMVLPEKDCALIPVAHTSAEELAQYLWQQVLAPSGKIGPTLRQRGNIDWAEVAVWERPGQGARFRDRPASTHVATRSAGPSKPCNCAAAIRPASCKPCMAPQQPQVPLSPVDQIVAECPAEGVSDPAEVAFRLLLDTLGRDEAGRNELLKTPKRAAKAWRELNAACFAGNPRDAVGDGIFNVDGAQDLVCVRDIPFQSLCEHHLLPFWGFGHVAYFPQGRVLGLSKFARLLQAIARRPQLQERLSTTFAETLDDLLGTRAVVVVLEAQHACMSLRGVQVPAVTRTVCYRGAFCKDRTTREELMVGIGNRARL